MARNKHADRDLRLTGIDGHPVTVNFNFVALREPAPVLPHDFAAMEDVARQRGVRLEGKDGEGEWRVRRSVPNGESSVAFYRHALPGTVLTVATGSAEKLIEVVQTPEEIARGLRKSNHDLHPAGLQKLATYETSEKRILGATIRRLES